MNNRLSLEIRPDVRADPDREVAAHPQRRRAGDRLGRSAHQTSARTNPPFGGSKFQSSEQRAQVRRVAALGGSGGTLDYVAAWFIRAGDYVWRAQPAEASKSPRIGFVATNSITQGEQVAQLWPLLLDHRRLEIAFAHRTFAWGSDARGKAHVHVVIIGLDAAGHAPRERRLFAYEDINGEPLEGRHAVITPYLVDGSALVNPHLVVREEGRPINGLIQLLTGSQPIDDGHYIFDAEERLAFLEAESDAAPFMRLWVSNSLSGRRWQLNQVPAVRCPPYVVEVRTGYRVSARHGERRVAVQGRVAPCRVVVGLEVGEFPLQIPRIPEEHLVQKFSPYRADQALYKGV